MFPNGRHKRRNKHPGLLTTLFIFAGCAMVDLWSVGAFSG